MINWAERLADDLRGVVTNADVYSNVDPTREWGGRRTVEVNVNSVTCIPLMRGGAYLDHNIVIACRALTYDAAAGLASEIWQNLDDILDGYVATRKALDAMSKGVEISPDVRGIVEGASFYGVINIVIVTKEETF